jgi:hypothetical protein
MTGGAQRSLAVCVLAAVSLSVRSVQAQSLQRVQGLAPDAQVVGGVGLGFKEPLDNPFVARARLGLLYAYEPWVFAAGPIVQIGALATPGLGGELEVGHFDGWYVDAGMMRAKGDGWVTHAAVGFMVVGLEWQHRFDVRDEDALLLQVRVPLGLWWFVDRKREEQGKRRAAASGGTRSGPTWRIAPTADLAPPAQPPQVPSTPSVPVGHVRVLIEGDSDGMTAEIDGQPAPTALRGYDVPLAPGEHELVIRRGGVEVVRQRFTLEPDVLLRLSPLSESPDQ